MQCTDNAFFLYTCIWVSICSSQRTHFYSKNSLLYKSLFWGIFLLYLLEVCFICIHSWSPQHCDAFLSMQLKRFLNTLGVSSLKTWLLKRLYILLSTWMSFQIVMWIESWRRPVENCRMKSYTHACRQSAPRKHWWQSAKRWSLWRATQKWINWAKIWETACKLETMQHYMYNVHMSLYIGMCTCLFKRMSTFIYKLYN